LSDADRSVGTQYQVLRNEGDRYSDYPERHAYLIDPDGIIARAYAVTDVAAFAAMVLDDLAARPR
jgi:peroxiredoxin